MTKYKDKFRIETTRLPSWGYGANAPYFVTICTKNREKFFGEIINNIVNLSPVGKIAQKYWLDIPKHFPFVELDEFIIMPNHVHGIIVINKPVVETQYVASQNQINKLETQHIAGTNVKTQHFGSLQKNKFGPQSQNLASIVRGFKSGVTTYVRKNNIEFGWQPRYYDHIIRNYKSWEKIRQYILKNPSKWLDDNEYQVQGNS